MSSSVLYAAQSLLHLNKISTERQNQTTALEKNMQTVQDAKKKMRRKNTDADNVDIRCTAGQ